jgi:hypothetical protein
MRPRGADPRLAASAAYLARKSDLPAPFGAPCLIGRRARQALPDPCSSEGQTETLPAGFTRLTQAQHGIKDQMSLDDACSEFLLVLANQAAGMKRKSVSMRVQTSSTMRSI